MLLFQKSGSWSVKTVLLSISILTVLFILSSCGTTKQAQDVIINNGFKDYQIENVGVGNDGTYVIRVTTHSSAPDNDCEVSAKNGVHAVLFRGVPAADGIPASAPIAVSNQAESVHKSFFDEFFKTKYQSFVKSISKGSLKIVRMNDGSFTTSVVIAIKKDELRRYLEDNEIIKPMVR